MAIGTETGDKAMMGSQGPRQCFSRGTDPTVEPIADEEREKMPDTVPERTHRRARTYN